MKRFQIACVDRIPLQEKASLFFTDDVKMQIEFILFGHLSSISMTDGGSRFEAAPGWSINEADLEPHDVVVYFVRSPMRSVAMAAGATHPPGDSAGFTATTPSGVACEVYVEMNLPAHKLANIAFHEIMHNKLDVGGQVIRDLHAQGGGGLAMSPTTESSQLSVGNRRLMAAHMFKPVRQYTGAM